MAPAIDFALATTCFSAAAAPALLPARELVTTARAQKIWPTHRSRRAAPVAAALPPGASGAAACAACWARAGEASVRDAASAAAAIAVPSNVFMDVSSLG